MVLKKVFDGSLALWGGRISQVYRCNRRLLVEGISFTIACACGFFAMALH